MVSPERIELRRAQLLVVDVQEKLLPKIHEHETVVRRAAVLIQACRVLRTPITVSEQYVAGLGPTVGALREHLADVPTLEKSAFSAWADPKLRARMNELLRPQVLLIGIETHVCVLQTALDLLEEQMTPVVLADAVSSRRSLDREHALNRLRDAGAIVSTVESAIFELLGVSGTPQFKQVLPLVRDL